MLLGVGGVFCAVAATAFLQERAYDAAVQADATVVDKQLRPATPDSSTAYELTYELRASGGAGWHKTDSVDAATWESVEQGGTVRVQYLPDDPGSLRIARRPRGTPFVFVAGVTSALALLGLWTLLRGIGAVWRTARLYRQGQSTEGTVTSVRETNVTVNRRVQWAIDFTFVDHLGQLQNGSSEPLPHFEALQWQEGDKGTVRFDPKCPQRAVWVGDVDERRSREPVPSR